MVTLDEIMKAIDVLSRMAEQSIGLREGSTDGIEMAMHLQIANLYLLEYAKHLIAGLEPYDALAATARGELKLSQRQRDLWKAMCPPGLGKTE